ESSDLFCRVHDKLLPNDFLNLYHKKIYEHLVNLVILNNAKIDKNLIYNNIKNSALKKYFEILIKAEGNVENIDQYILEIKKASKLHNIRNISTDLQYILSTEDPNPDTIIDEVEEKLIRLSVSGSTDFDNTKDVVSSVLEEIRSGGIKYD